MSDFNDARSLIRDAATLWSAARIRIELDRKFAQTLLRSDARILSEAGWHCDRQDRLYPKDWPENKKGFPLVWFELRCLCEEDESQWLATAAGKAGGFLAYVLELRKDLPWKDLFAPRVREILKSGPEELLHAAFQPCHRDSGVRHLVIPVRRVPLEDLADACPDWLPVMEGPLSEALVTVRVAGQALDSLVRELSAGEA